MSNLIDNATFARLIWGLSGMDKFSKYGSYIKYVVSDICKLTGLEEDSQDFDLAIKEGLKEMSKDWTRLNEWNTDENIRGYADGINAYWWFNNGESRWTMDKPDWWDEEKEETEIKRKELLEILDGLKVKYDDIIDEINILKADGSLSKLCNLRDTFDETFDQFFDDKELRIKYDDWNFETDSIAFNLCNRELEELLDNADLQGLISFYEGYIGRLEDELRDLKGDR